MYETISSFNNVDKTLLTWKNKLSDFYRMVSDDLSFINCKTKYTQEEIDKEVQIWLGMYYRMFAHVMTDTNGFNYLLNRIKKSNSDIIFLTARAKIKRMKNFFYKFYRYWIRL